MRMHIAVPVAWIVLSGLVLLWFNAVMIDCTNAISAECDQAVWSSWLDLWRLKWIYNYKELIAGIAAAGAAALILVATRIELAEARSAAAGQQSEMNAAVFSTLAHTFGTASATMITATVSPDVLKLFDDIEFPPGFIAKWGHFYSLARVDTLNAKRALDDVLAYQSNVAAAGAHPIKTSKRVRINVFRSRMYLELFNHLAIIENRRLKYQQAFPSKKLIDMIDQLNITREEAGRGAKYFSWPPGSPMALELEDLGNFIRD